MRRPTAASRDEQGSRDTQERTFFFVHLMRTGGMTLLHHLRQNFAADEVYPDRDLDFPDGDILEHLQLSHRARSIRIFRRLMRCSSQTVAE